MFLGMRPGVAVIRSSDEIVLTPREARALYNGINQIKTINALEESTTTWARRLEQECKTYPGCHFKVRVWRRLRRVLVGTHRLDDTEPDNGNPECEGNHFPPVAISCASHRFARQPPDAKFFTASPPSDDHFGHREGNADKKQSAELFLRSRTYLRRALGSGRQRDRCPTGASAPSSGSCSASPRPSRSDARASARREREWP